MHRECAPPPVETPCEYDEQLLELLRRIVQQFRGGLVSKARRLCASLNSRLESNRKEEEESKSGHGGRRAATINFRNNLEIARPKNRTSLPGFALPALFDDFSQSNLLRAVESSKVDHFLVRQVDHFPVSSSLSVNLISVRTIKKNKKKKNKTKPCSAPCSRESPLLLKLREVPLLL